MAPRNIVLVGFMGTGKSTLGQLLADRLQRRFVDMDTVIEEREGRSIADIFATDGEQRFRAIEHAVARDLGADAGLVIATGGGVVTNPHNMTALGADSLIVCLQAAPRTILDRVGGDPARPLVAGPDADERVAALLAERAPYYDAVACTVRTDDKSPTTAVDEIVRLCAAWRDNPREDVP